MTINGLTKLLKKREMLARQKELWENELENIDNIRGIRFYQPNLSESAPYSKADEVYSSYICRNEDKDSTFDSVKNAYMSALVRNVAKVGAEVAHIDAIMEQAETLLSEIPEE